MVIAPPPLLGGPKCVGQAAAKIVFICHRQLEELIRATETLGKDKHGPEWSQQTLAPTYTRILETLTEAFSIDQHFADSIRQFKPLDEKSTSYETYEVIRASSQILLGSVRAFIELHMAPSEKKKTIGFTNK